MVRVFVSHATADAAFAEKFSNDLRAFGVDVWLDSSHVGPGDFVTRISAALQRDVLILILTPAAIASPWVQQEMNAAITRANQKLMRSPMVVMAAPCTPQQIPALWTVYHRYDTTQDYMPVLARIVRELDTPPSASPRVAGPQQPVHAAPMPAAPIPAAPRTPAPFTAAPITLTPITPPPTASPPIAASPVGGVATMGSVTPAVQPSRRSAAANVRFTRADWALVSGAAVIAIAALVVMYYSRVLWQFDFTWLGALALALEAGVIGVVSFRRQVQHFALVAVCEAALGLNAVFWFLYTVSGGGYRGVDWQPPALWFTIIALAVLPVTYTLRAAAGLRQGTRLAVNYAIALACFGVYLLIFENEYTVGPTPLEASNVALTLLALVYTLGRTVSGKQWRWLVVCSIIAVPTLFAFMFPKQTYAVLSPIELKLQVTIFVFAFALTPLAPLIYGLFARNNTSMQGTTP